MVATNAPLTAEQDAFIQGVAWAIATLSRIHGEPGMAADLVNESGLRLKDFKAADEYDRSEIRRIFRTERSRLRHV